MIKNRKKLGRIIEDALAKQATLFIATYIVLAPIVKFLFSAKIHFVSHKNISVWLHNFLCVTPSATFH